MSKKTFDFNEALINLAHDAMGEGNIDRLTPEEALEVESMGLFSIIVRSIELYAERTDYVKWSTLADTISETFEQDLIDADDRTYLYMVSFNDKNHENILMTARAAQAMSDAGVAVMMIDQLSDPTAKSAAADVYRKCMTVARETGIIQ